jgi:hypothetical protein
MSLFADSPDPFSRPIRRIQGLALWAAPTANMAGFIKMKIAAPLQMTIK